MRKEYRNKHAEDDATTVPKSRKNVKKPFVIQFERIRGRLGCPILHEAGWHTWKKYTTSERAIKALAVLRKRESDPNNAYGGLFRYRLDPATCPHDGDPCSLCPF